MKAIQDTFRRHEKKFLMTSTQYASVLQCLKTRMSVDEYGLHTICNVYFDTDQYDLIRTSLEKPQYKEKFRLRSYGVQKTDGVVFAEIKKKFDGVVYKRRIAAAPQDIQTILTQKRATEQDRQIQSEIQWFFSAYKPKPKVFIAYERLALAANDDPELRITFDRNIRWRTEQLDLCSGDKGDAVLTDGSVVMEVKALGGIPLWLVSMLSEQKIYATSFSKYGVCYQRHIAATIFGKGRFIHA